MRKLVLFAFFSALIVAAVPAMASGATLTAGGITLGAGDPIMATSSDLLFTGSSGLSLECATRQVVGTYDGGTTIEIEEGTFTNATGGPCATNNPSVTVHMTPINLPWVLHLNNNDVAEFTGMAFTATFTVGGTSVNHCTFTANNGVTSGTYNTTEPLKITISGANFTGAPVVNCGTAVLNGSFTLSSGGNHIEAH